MKAHDFPGHHRPPDFTKGIFGGAFQATGFVQSPLLPMYQFYNYYLGPGVILNQHGWDDPALDKLWKTGAAAQSPIPTGRRCPSGS